MVLKSCGMTYVTLQEKRLAYSNLHYDAGTWSPPEDSDRIPLPATKCADRILNDISLATTLRVPVSSFSPG